jgi:hypothetical protein
MTSKQIGQDMPGRSLSSLRRLWWMVGCWVDVWLMDNCWKVALRVDVSETGVTDELWAGFHGKGSAAGFHKRRLVMDVGPVHLWGLCACFLHVMHVMHTKVYNHVYLHIRICLCFCFVGFPGTSLHKAFLTTSKNPTRTNSLIWDTNPQLHKLRCCQ